MASLCGCRGLSLHVSKPATRSCRGLPPVLPSNPPLEGQAASPLLVSVAWTAGTRQRESPSGSRGCSRAEGQPSTPTGSHHTGRGAVAGPGLLPQSCALNRECQPFASFPSSLHYVLGKEGYPSFSISTQQPGLGLLLDGGLLRFLGAQHAVAPHLPRHSPSPGLEPPCPKCELPATCHGPGTDKEQLQVLPDRAGLFQPMMATHALQPHNTQKLVLVTTLLTLLKINGGGAIVFIRPQDKEGQKCTRRNHT